MNNRERLIEIMIEQKLDRLELAKLLCVKKKDIDQWLLSNKAKEHKEVPDMAIELLQYKLDA
tara:strand:+ start:57 stop:242 length:186 start_codon:yes stop_codon:yes gene_type:complete